MLELLEARYVYFLVIALLAIGLYGMLAQRNLVKKIIGMVIFQTAIYVFFIEGSVRRDATVPVIDPARGVEAYVNPLPHLLILTAIVVGVGVLGVALSLIMRIHRAYGTLDEDALLRRFAGDDAGEDAGDRERAPGPDAGGA
jgi:multicomponent Na+:H+ antiporter subunit C